MAAKRSIFDEGAVLVPEVLDAGAARKTLAAIDTGPWSTEIGRRVQHYGYRYSYSGRAAQPTPTTPFPPWAEVLGGAVARHFGRQPTQCIVNEYEPGQGIGMHADAPTFGPVIVSVTLGSAWEMRFRAPGVRPYSRDGLDDDEKARLPVGSALVLTGEARWRWMHGICRQASQAEQDRRVSATFRTLA